jgi:hypothetical protein
LRHLQIGADRRSSQEGDGQGKPVAGGRYGHRPEVSRVSRRQLLEQVPGFLVGCKRLYADDGRPRPAWYQVNHATSGHHDAGASVDARHQPGEGIRIGLTEGAIGVVENQQARPAGSQPGQCLAERRPPDGTRDPFLGVRTRFPVLQVDPKAPVHRMPAFVLQEPLPRPSGIGGVTAYSALSGSQGAHHRDEAMAGQMLLDSRGGGAVFRP